MKEELSKSGLSEEEILHKTKTIMKAFGKEDADASLLDLSLVSKQKNSALRQAGISPKEFAKVGYFEVYCRVAILRCIIYWVLIYWAFLDTSRLEEFIIL